MASRAIWKGNPSLQPLLASLDDLDEDPRNVRRHPQKNIDAIKMSYSTFGQTKPIVVWRSSPDARLIALAGNGTMRSLREMGWTHIAISEFLGSEVNARAYAVADNQIPLMAEWDEPALAEEMAWISNEFQPAAVDAEWASVDVDAGDVVKDNTSAADGLSHRERDRGREEQAPDIDIDLAQEMFQVSPGDLYQLGAHRLICGDSTDSATLDRLMGGERATFLHADPPYGMNKGGVINDDLHGSKLDAFQVAWWCAARVHLVDNASAFVWGNPEDLWRWWFTEMVPTDAAPDREFLALKNEIVWDKGEAPGMMSDEMRSVAISTERALLFMLGAQKLSINSDNHWEGWEPLRTALAAEVQKAGWTSKDIQRITGTQMGKHWFTKSQWTFVTEENYLKLQEAGKEFDAFQYPYEAVRSVYITAKAAFDAEVAEKFYAERAYFDNASDNCGEVWSFPRVTGSERFGHNTPKPVAMIARAIKLCCPVGGIVLEPFAGSGTTLIAAEETGRKCYTAELSPKYAATTIVRWQGRTGLKAEKIGGANE